MEAMVAGQQLLFKQSPKALSPIVWTVLVFLTILILMRLGSSRRVFSGVCEKRVLSSRRTERRLDDTNAPIDPSCTLYDAAQRNGREQLSFRCHQASLHRWQNANERIHGAPSDRATCTTYGGS